MRDRLQTQLFGPYFGSFSAHSYGYELSNDPKSDHKLLDFRFGPILGQPPRRDPKSTKRVQIKITLSPRILGALGVLVANRDESFFELAWRIKRLCRLM